MQSQIDYEHLVETLAAADETYSPSDEFTDSSVLKVKADLDLLQKHLQQPPPADPFGEESACEQALNLVAAIGRDPSFVTRQQLAVEPVPAADEQTALPGGGMLGQYRLLTKLGEGGFGTVYKAVHTRLDKVVALKLLTASRLQNPDAVTRFNREMRAVGKLHHAHIVAAHDAGEIDGTHYLVMELVDGIDLRELVKQRGRLPIGAACEIIRQAALGLQHAHDHGLVHRDIKPSNLMLTLPGNHDEAPSVKVLDLGLALLDEDHLENFGELTATGQVMGTLEYMAPEQGSDTHAVDIRADIYSLGASLYKLLTGKPPFSSDQYRSPIKLLMALATQDPPPLVTRCPEITSELEAIVRQMLAKKPQERFATPRELAEALAPFSQPADVRALVDFLATTPVEEPVDVNAPEYIGTPAIDNPQPRPPVAAAPATTTSVAASPARTRTNVRWLTTLALTACGLFIAAASYVIRIQTDQGELIIHSDHPGISVKVKSNGEEVGNGWTMLKGADNKQFIRTGQIEIELPAELTGEYTVTPNVVTLTKNKQEVVKIERKETSHAADHDAHEHAHDKVVQLVKPVSPPNATAVNRDRVAANWLVNLGGSGSAVFELSGQHNIQIHPASAIPDVHFKLTSVTLTPLHLANPDALRHLAGLTKLRQLYVASAFDEGKPPTLDELRMNFIGLIPGLQELSIQHCQVKTSTLKALNKLPFLRSITINSKQVDDDWQFVKELQYLRTINIYDHYVPSPADFAKWRQFPQLRRIHLHYNKLLDAAITAPLHEGNPYSLCQTVLDIGSEKFRGEQETVVLGFNPVRAGTISLLAQGFRLSTDVWFGSHGDLTKEMLQEGKKINPLAINAVQIPQELKQPGLKGLGELSLAGFAQVPFVRLDANGLQKADDFVVRLPQSAEMEDIFLKDSDLTDEGLRQLERLDPFVTLYVQGTKVTKAGIEAFLRRRPACIVHSDYGVLEGTFSEQPSADSSRDVTIIDRDRDREAAQSWIKGGGRCTVILKRNGKEFFVSGNDRLPPAPFELREANATSENFTEDLQLFVGLTGLQRISIQGNKVDTAVVGILSQIPNLRSILFRDSQIWTSELAGLGKLPFLHEIAISTNQVDDDWKFLGNLPHLRSLIVRHNNRPSIADFQKLSEFPQLRTILVEGAISDELAATLHEKNPLCRIIAQYILRGDRAGIGGGAIFGGGVRKAG